MFIFTWEIVFQASSRSNFAFIASSVIKCFKAISNHLKLPQVLPSNPQVLLMTIALHKITAHCISLLNHANCKLLTYNFTQNLNCPLYLTPQLCWSQAPDVHAIRPREAPAEPCPGDSRFERQILAWSWSGNSGFEAPIWAFGGELCPLIADLGTTGHKFLWEILAPPGPQPSAGIWSSLVVLSSSAFQDTKCCLNRLCIVVHSIL